MSHLFERFSPFRADTRCSRNFVKGNQVAPAELESLLLEHPDVADAAVIGVPTPDGDESPQAYVVLQPDAKSKATKPDDIVAFVAENVARHKRLTGGVRFIDVYVTSQPATRDGGIISLVVDRTSGKSSLSLSPTRQTR